MFGEKLREILEDQGISPSQFADSIGVNRSAISHVLNNRNKPGYDLLNKMHENYPDWDYDWLVFNKTKAKPKQRTKPYKQTEPIIENNNPNYLQGSLFNDEGEPEKTQSYNPQRLKRTVTKTILIYSDGTFEIFQNNFG
ncbi:MAG: helix-turn-helix transcriptional regulator [Bacteroidia bacterium]